jgi:peptidyl-prolyl cis-trans isomerase B (cyclophilin B)
MAKNLFTFILCSLLLALTVIAQSTPSDQTVKKEETTEPAKKTNQRPAEPERKPEPFDKTDVQTMATKCVIFETEKGKIKMEMFPESAPNTVRNFLNLVAIGALDNTTFSRVVPNFVIQGGDLYTNENITNEFKWRAVRTIPDEPNLIKHERGILSMARSNEPNSASTSFFILVSESSSLDGTFAAFGKVTAGMEVVDEINKMPVENEKPKEPVRLTEAKIETCRAAAASEELKTPAGQS